MQRAIAIENYEMPNNRGLVTPLYIFENEQWREVTEPRIDFPNNGKIFVLGNYAVIQNTFNKKPFFIDYQISSQPYENENDSKYVAHGTNTSLPFLQLCRIYAKETLTYNNDSLITLLLKDKPSNAIFINHDNNILGPFSTTEFDQGDDGYYELQLKSSSIYGEGLIYTIPIKAANEFIIEIEGNNFILNAEHFISSVSEKTQTWYLGKKEILAWAKSQFGKNIDSSLHDFLKDFVSVDESDYRIQKLKELSKSAIEWLPVRDKILFEFFQTTEGGKQVIETFLQENRNKILSEHTPEIAEPLSSISVEDSYDNKLQHLTDLQRNFVAELIENTDELSKYIEFEDFNKERIIVEFDTRQKQETLAKLSEQVSLKNQELEDFKNAYESLKTELINQSTIKKNLLNIKTYTDILNGIELTPNVETETPSISDFKVYPFYDTLPDLKEYVQSVVDKLELRGRKISFNDVFNYLILINQNFLTVFAGYPGTGKTSLVRELSRIIGIDPFFTAISVARGWTSIKDFIGYWNPLTQRFQSSNNELYKNLLLHQNDKFSSYPFWVLLDEANLSPMEHYWSDFMMLNDIENVDRRLAIRESNDQNPRQIELGAGFGFIATINFDHTTETLSPRLKDRAAIVMIDIPEFKNINFDQAQNVNPSQVLSVAQSKELFNSRPNRKLSQDESIRLESIINVLKDNGTDRGVPIVVSPRKIKAINQYCAIAKDLMEKESDTQFTALDYAVHQFILPIVEGRTENFKRRLEALSKEITLLPKSSERLKKMIDFGKMNNHNYRFFC